MKLSFDFITLLKWLDKKQLNTYEEMKSIELTLKNLNLYTSNPLKDYNHTL